MTGVKSLRATLGAVLLCSLLLVVVIVVQSDSSRYDAAVSYLRTNSREIRPVLPRAGPVAESSPVATHPAVQTCPEASCIHGFVADSSGRPLAGVEVRAVVFPEGRFRVIPVAAEALTTCRTTTNGVGRYELLVPSSHPQHLKAAGPGWTSAFAEAYAGERVDFTLLPEGRLAVFVRSPDNRPIARARARLKFEDVALYELAGESDERGRVVLSSP